MLNITHYYKNANQIHLTLVRMVINKKTETINAWEDVEKMWKKILLHCWWESKWIQPLWRTVWRFLKKPGIKLPYDPAIPPLGIYRVCVHVCVCVLSCPTLCNPMDCRPPGSSVHQISQARILGWVAIPFSRGSFKSRDQTHVSGVSCIGRQILAHWAIWEAPK